VSKRQRRGENAGIIIPKEKKMALEVREKNAGEMQKNVGNKFNRLREEFTTGGKKPAGW